MQRVACTLGFGQMDERRRRWRELAGRAFAGRTETEEGIRLAFRQEDGVETELRELARLERECCAFADWSVAAVDGFVRLDVTGDGTEAVAAVHAMFRTL